MSIFSVNNNLDQSITGLNGHFIHSLLLIDILMRMQSIESDKQQLISLFKKEYQNNQTQLSLIDDFENNYSTNKAVLWYTRDSFLYKMLNKALRIQNIDLLFLFRFVIADIHRQLKENQCQSPIRVYRGQAISNDELNTLQQSTGKLISINSFFSTSINRHEALGFLSDCNISNDLHRILFVIDADPNVVRSKPFANISSLSDFASECEILFMIECVFRLVDVYLDNSEQVWIIWMELCSDDQHDLKQLFNHLKKEYGDSDSEVNLRSFGDVLRGMGKYDLAEKMYHRLLNEHSLNDNSLGSLYCSLGLLTKDKGEYDASLQWFHKALELHKQNNPSDHVNIGGIYNWIGVLHRKKGDNNIVLKYYNDVVTLFEQAHTQKHPAIGYTYNNIAIIYDQQKKYNKALNSYKKALSIHEIHLPANHPSIAITCNNIGNVYLNIGQYDLAMKYYEQALQIRLKSLPPLHPELSRSYKSIGLIYERRSEWKEALAYYQKAATIRCQSLPAQHPDVIQIEEDIQRISSKLA